MENDILKEALGVRSRKMWITRSHVRDLLGRNEDWSDGRSHRTPIDDAVLLAELSQEIAGYRRACALVNRQRTARGTPRGNAKRVYRVMAQVALRLPKAPRRRQSARMSAGLRSDVVNGVGALMIWKSSVTPAGS